MAGFFITASGTGLGKTLVTAALCHQLRKKGEYVFALKPVITGYTFSCAIKPDTNDTLLLLESLNLPATEETIQTVSPYRFIAPLSPDMAARMENRKIDFAAVVTHCRKYMQHDFLLIEGAGGAMAPLTEKHTMLDVMKTLGMPAIVVVGSYLGAISHALTACRALETEGIAIQAVVLNETQGSPVPLKETEQALLHHLQKSVFTLPWLGYGADIWRRVPDLLPIVGMEHGQKEKRKRA